MVFFNQSRKVLLFNISLLVWGFILGLFVSFFLSNSVNEKFFNEKSVEEYFGVEDVDKYKTVLEYDKELPKKFDDVDLDQFFQVWEALEKFYISPPVEEEDEEEEEFSFDREEFLDYAIEGLTRATKDPNTNFFKPKEAKDFKSEVVEGSIEGIGAFVGIRNNLLTVIEPLKDGPAFKSGLKSNDVIYKIDGELSSQFNLTQSIERIRGKKGTVVDIEILRERELEPLSFPIVRDSVNIPTISTEKRDNVFIIKISNFSKLTRERFLEEVNQLEGKERVLLDLRSNPGGLLNSGLDIADFFLPKNSVVLYEYTGDENFKVFKTRKGSIFVNDKTPIITVLVNGSSASTSEILASALKYHGIADIVGQKTFGKGTVQSLKNIGNNGALLKVTVAHWLTPEKKSISEIGIEPDVDFTEDILEELEKDEDLDVSEFVLNKAIKHLQDR